MTSRFNRDKFSNRATVKVPEDPIEQDTQSKQEEFAGVERNAQGEFASQDTQTSRENVQPGEYAAPETAERRGTRYSFTHDQLADPDE